MKRIGLVVLLAALAAAGCAALGVLGGSSEVRDLSAVARVALARLDTRGVTIVAGETLGPVARRALGRVTKYVDWNRVGTKEVMVPEGYFEVTELSVTGDEAKVFVLKGPVYRQANWGFAARGFDLHRTKSGWLAQERVIHVD
jgi:hypothetical protein